MFTKNFSFELSFAQIPKYLLPRAKIHSNETFISNFVEEKNFKAILNSKREHNETKLRTENDDPHSPSKTIDCFFCFH